MQIQTIGSINVTRVDGQQETTIELGGQAIVREVYGGFIMETATHQTRTCRCQYAGYTSARELDTGAYQVPTYNSNPSR